MVFIEVVGYGIEIFGNFLYLLNVFIFGEQYIGGIFEMLDVRKFIIRYNFNFFVDGLY